MIPTNVTCVVSPRSIVLTSPRPMAPTINRGGDSKRRGSYCRASEYNGWAQQLLHDDAPPPLLASISSCLCPFYDASSSSVVLFVKFKLDLVTFNSSKLLIS